MATDTKELVSSEGRRYVPLGGIEIISRYKKKDKKIRNKIIALTAGEIAKSKVIGKASGIDFNHCLFIGWRYADRFFERIYGYRIVAPRNKEMGMSVVFYEKGCNPKKKSRSKPKTI